MFVVSFANLKSCALSGNPLGDCVMPSAEVHARAQASHRNITVLNHLNVCLSFCYTKVNSNPLKGLF